MTKTRHSFVAFYPSDWLGGTARMTRLVKSVYFDICLYNWDKAEPAPEPEVLLMLDDLGDQGEKILNVLVASRRLVRNSDGSVYSKRALAAGQEAFEMWRRKSEGGKKGAIHTNASAAGSAGGSAGEVGPGVPPHNHNQNHNQNQKEGIGPSALVIASDDPAPKPPRKSYNVLAIEAAWNEMAKANGLAVVKTMTEERRKKTRARLDDYPEEEIIEAIALIPQRPFCMGANDRRWKATFDWLVRPGTVTKIREGSEYMGGQRGSGWLDGD